MEYLVTGAEMKRIDSYSITEIGIPSLVLMERAALAVADVILKKWNCENKVLILCGTGNNGADGLALFRILRERGYKAEAAFLGSEEKASREWKTQFAIVKRLGYSVLHLEEADMERLDSFPVIVDAIFGIGLEREITGIYKTVIDGINQLDASRICIDIPSGIHSGTGRIMDTAVKADVTVTFGFKKRGMVLFPGREYCKEVIVADIGFPAESINQNPIGAFTYTKKDLARIPVRPAFSNKGTFGKVLIIAGSKNMSGAAYFSAKAAYRMGAGLVRIMTVEENRQILQTQLPEAVLSSFRPEELNDPFIEEACTWATAIVIGPGLGTEPCVFRLMEAVLRQAYVPLVIDADALNVISTHPELTSYFTENIIITPHPGEMSRLIRTPVGEIAKAPLEAARRYSEEYGIICVLKGAATVVTEAGGADYINTSGNSGMATAGAGDVLAGMIGGLLAFNMKEFEAACLGVYLHGLAGDLAKEEAGEYGMTASDILEQIKYVMSCGGSGNEAI